MGLNGEISDRVRVAAEAAGVPGYKPTNGAWTVVEIVRIALELDVDPGDLILGS